jgi:phosphoribosylglycinamide formyltransferase 2
MVTLAGTQNLNEFELHARAILGLPIHRILLEKAGVSAVILAESESQSQPIYSGIKESLIDAHTDIRIFGKPSTRKFRRMGVSLVSGPLDTNMDQLRQSASACAGKVKVLSRSEI